MSYLHPECRTTIDHGTTNKSIWKWSTLVNPLVLIIFPNQNPFSPKPNPWGAVHLFWTLCRPRQEVDNVPVGDMFLDSAIEITPQRLKLCECWQLAMNHLQLLGIKQRPARCMANSRVAGFLLLAKADRGSPNTLVGLCIHFFQNNRLISISTKAWFPAIADIHKWNLVTLCPMLSRALIILRISASRIYRRLHSFNLMVGTSSDERRCACISRNQPETRTLQKDFRICSMNSDFKNSWIQKCSAHNTIWSHFMLSHCSCLSMFRATPWTSVRLCGLLQNLFLYVPSPVNEASSD